MIAGQLSNAVRQLRRIVQDAPGMPDADLLKRYVRLRDESAFEALVERHGPLVLSVCWRVLHKSHDAEDAFQATFLVLARKAKTLRSPEMIANWLYGVAYRTAREAKRSKARRGKQERQVANIPMCRAKYEEGDLEYQLDQELSQLPDKYRVVLLLCDLEGQTRKQAAIQLRLPEGTVASRLARARNCCGRDSPATGLGFRLQSCR